MGKISIFLTNLGEYNRGCLIGEWIKLPIDEDDLESVLACIGINDEYEEYFITDYESMFSNLHINEYSSISDLNTLAAQLDSLADYELEKLEAVLESEGNTSISDVIELTPEIVMLMFEPVSPSGTGNTLSAFTFSELSERAFAA